MYRTHDCPGIRDAVLHGGGGGVLLQQEAGAMGVRWAYSCTVVWCSRLGYKQQPQHVLRQLSQASDVGHPSIEWNCVLLVQVLAPVVAWKPPPRPQASGQGPFQGFAKALTFRQPAADAATAEGDTAAAEAAGVGGDAAATAAEAVEGVGHLPISQAGLAEAHKVTPLDDAELDAIVTVLEYMISHFSGVFGA